MKKTLKQRPEQAISPLMAGKYAIIEAMDKYEKNSPRIGC